MIFEEDFLLNEVEDCLRSTKDFVSWGTVLVYILSNKRSKPTDIELFFWIASTRLWPINLCLTLYIFAHIVFFLSKVLSRKSISDRVLRRRSSFWRPINLLGSDPYSLHYVFIVFPFAMGEFLLMKMLMASFYTWRMCLLWQEYRCGRCCGGRIRWVFRVFRFPQKFPRLLFMDGRLTWRAASFLWWRPNCSRWRVVAESNFFLVPLLSFFLSIVFSDGSDAVDFLEPAEGVFPVVRGLLSESRDALRGSARVPLMLRRHIRVVMVWIN